MNKTIVITGASRGIGLLTVKTLAREGHQVFAAMRGTQGKNKEEAQILENYAKEKSVHIKVIEMDVTDEESVNHAIKTIATGNKLDVVINNAGIMPVGLTEAFTIEDYQRCMDVNVYGPARVMRAALPFMREQKSGLFINISSNAGRIAIPYFGVYCASKFALEAYTESMHYELEPFGIEAVLVEPGGHGTNLIHSAPKPSDEQVLGQYGNLATGRDRLLGMFEGMFAQQEDATNAQNIADEILSLINMEVKRPLRTTVGHDMGVGIINAASIDPQQELVESLKSVYLVTE
ncbi:SDR family oxidoreductase [Flagellimonas zhangzhouensis]|uniref:NADP-dependent 3-hydroxy acid dehydrogenase YdfG n=1 Tax=Flagellimonas zhangzhouensis TaxID=1073328 RepID=A0A1H2SYA2_9FLAO|nr:SDR family oxidoreductase [Allomuricauda zhangzhouensis]SDQ81273.1 NADP-dependent 3-hydroxy acid dehydrogenase YdfG [Allomuricauda zhangzhouensis]SDW36582.1 NADP-dependent 3-hydroxy acid dehydrogenase YdfG [Allomuricauda zhangzhouensis]